MIETTGTTGAAGSPSTPSLPPVNAPAVVAGAVEAASGGTTAADPSAAAPGAASIPSPAEEAKNPDELASGFAALARKERKIREMESKAKELAKKYGELDPILANPKERLTDIIDYLQKNGVTWDDLAHAEIKRSKPLTAEEKAEDALRKLEEFKKQQAEEKENFEKERINRAVVGFKKTIESVVKEGGDKFELVRAYKDMGTDTISMIYEVCAAVYEQTGKELPVDQAAAQIEEQLLDHTKRFASVGKVRSLFTPPEAPAPSPEMGKATLESVTAAKEKSVPATSKTLTNSVGPVATVSSEPKRALSREESIAEAAKLLRSMRQKQA